MAERGDAAGVDDEEGLGAAVGLAGCVGVPIIGVAEPVAVAMATRAPSVGLADGDTVPDVVGVSITVTGTGGEVSETVSAPTTRLPTTASIMSNTVGILPRACIGRPTCSAGHSQTRPA